MDFVGYAALGGLERLTIVAGAIIIGYWGYRLYTGEKAAGLVFMGLAVLVLVAALATGTVYLRSVGEGLQLASVPVGEAAAPAAPPAPAAVVEAPASPSAPVPAAEPTGTVAPEAPSADVPVAPTAAGAAPETAAGTSDTASQEAATTKTQPASPVRLATGAELGGRIVSVKSENISLEWSSDSD